ncbi:P-loop containing nucleoside triphosphate hydrolase protein [Crucibulum laeve]|uniref:P-loop containing nucleoside triphosphate hydrolase protein n=1 Tax=Crucibulum laeve TaxID=68775 RepID=A0A5C3M567_9AGAR|nr:P-loop containing nucleoside triphosphate hydrolase protein [Crucibulum laeve]
MATPLIIAQQILSAITNSAGDSLLSVSQTNATTNGTSAVSVPTPTAMPTDLASLLTFLFSFSALRDWFKLIVIGSVFETARRLVFHFYYKLINSIFITARFQEDDNSYSWMMIWLSKQPAWTEARDVEISTHSFGLSDYEDREGLEGEDEPMSLASGGRKVAFLPSISSTYTIWYKNRWMRVTRTEKQTGYYGKAEETLEICILAWDRRVLNQLLLEAKKEYMSAKEQSISIYVSDVSNNWRHVASRPKRPLHSIVLDPGIKDLLIDDATDFLQSKNWYSVRGIPFRRGYLLYGAPGSGKTSIIHSLAGELGLDVYVISLSRAGLDDNALSGLISELPQKCIALMEDIDAAFTQTLNRDEEPTPPVPGGPPAPPSSKISLSGLLNALDGVGAQEGRILFATTNKYSSLDPALCRPGRMDIHIEFKLASKYQAAELYRRFYMPDAEEESEKGSVDSGYASISDEKEKDLIALDDTSSEASEPSTPAKTSPPPLEVPVFIGGSHRFRAPKLSREQIDDFATQFSEAIPEREFSMASLQGYLMMYKIRPADAAKEAGEWVARERADKAAKLAALEAAESKKAAAKQQVASKPQEIPAPAEVKVEKTAESS